MLTTQPGVISTQCTGNRRRRGGRREGRRERRERGGGGDADRVGQERLLEGKMRERRG
jgi:hypothetical protein